MGDFSFSDSTNPDQALLFNDPSIAPLVADLAAKFRPAGQIPVAPQNSEHAVRVGGRDVRREMRGQGMPSG